MGSGFESCEKAYEKCNELINKPNKLKKYIFHYLNGGIIEYAHQVKKNNLPSKFIGKNFDFDDRLGERITEDIISKCHLCESITDNHTNCNNDACHILFIICKECNKKLDGCCSIECQNIYHLPIEEQREVRKKFSKKLNEKHRLM